MFNNICKIFNENGQKNYLIVLNLDLSAWCARVQIRFELISACGAFSFVLRCMTAQIGLLMQDGIRHYFYCACCYLARDSSCHKEKVIRNIWNPVSFC